MHCEIALCDECLARSESKYEDKSGIPMTVTKDNFWGYSSNRIYKYRVRWIEAAAATPVLTCLISYYVEGDRGHLLNAEQHRPRHAYAVRGNVYSFHMPWEEIGDKLLQVLSADGKPALP